MKITIEEASKKMGLSGVTVRAEAKELLKIGIDRIKSKKRKNRLKKQRLNDSQYLSLLIKINNDEKIVEEDIKGLSFKDCSDCGQKFSDENGELDLKKINRSIEIWAKSDGANMRHDSILKM